MNITSFFRIIILLLSLPTAWAADTPSNASFIVNILPLLAIVVFFYFIIIRPQQQEQNELKNIQDGLKTKQEILTMSGILGEITMTKDDWVQMKTVSDTCFWIKRSQIQKVLPNGTIKHLESK